MGRSMSVSVGVHITLFRDPCAFCHMWLYDYRGIILLAEKKPERKDRVTPSCTRTSLSLGFYSRTQQLPFSLWMQQGDEV